MYGQQVAAPISLRNSAACVCLVYMYGQQMAAPISLHNSDACVCVSGPDISADQEDHPEGPSRLVSHGYRHRISDGHRHGSKSPHPYYNCLGLKKSFVSCNLILTVFSNSQSK